MVRKDTLKNIFPLEIDFELFSKIFKYKNMDDIRMINFNILSCFVLAFYWD